MNFQLRIIILGNFRKKKTEKIYYIKLKLTNELSHTKNKFDCFKRDEQTARSKWHETSAIRKKTRSQLGTIGFDFPSDELKMDGNE